MADLNPPSVSAAGSRAQRTTGGKTLKKTTKKKAGRTFSSSGAPSAHGIPTGGDRLAQWLANPGLRSRLPDSALPADLLKTRQTNTYNAAPAAPGSQYTNGSLDKLIGILTQKKYGPAETELQQQGTALNNRQNTEIPAWFQEYRNTVGAARQGQAVADQARIGSLQQMAAAATSDTGGPTDPNDPAAAQRAQAAAAIRGAGVSNQAALATNLGGISDTYLGNLGLNSFGMQQGAIQQVGTQKNDLATRIAQLAQEKGDFGVTQRSSILGEEGDAALKAALTNSQIGQNKASTANTKATTTKTKAATKKTQAEQDYFKEHGYYPSTGKPAVKSPDVITSGAFAGYTKTQVAKMTPDKKNSLKSDYAKNGGKGSTDKDQYGNTSKQRQASNDALDKALVYARQAVKDKKHGPSLAGDWKALANALVVGFGVNSKYATAAAQQVVLGHMGPNTSKELKRRGVKARKPGKSTVTKTVDDAISKTSDVISSIPGLG